MMDLFENWNRYYFPDIGRYLSPEPMLQAPAFPTFMAKLGLSTPTYAYANNNPVGMVDPNGLYSYRHACPGKAWTGDERGFVVFHDDVFGNRQESGTGSVGFDNQGASACDDCRVAKDIKARAKGTVTWVFGDADSCWDELIKEVCGQCDAKKRAPCPTTAPKQGVARGME